MDTIARSVCVVKLGGSLLDVPGLPARLFQVLQTESAQTEFWLIPGGGRFAEEIRRLDRISHWPAEVSHRLAIQTMGLTAQLVAESSPLFERVEKLDAVSTPGRVRVLDVSQLPEIDGLPATWEITSDSIAAFVATRLQASRLLLLKSISLPSPPPSADAAARAGWVDSCFAGYAAKIPQVCWQNFRQSEEMPQTWLQWGVVVGERG